MAEHRLSAAGARYVSLTTSGAGESSPVLAASNPMGNALLSSGLMSLAGSTAASMAPILPVRLTGIDVRQTLHRFDTGARPPAGGRSAAGVTGVNRIGEALGTIAMRWLVAPEGFEATPSSAPPATELDAARSQRFVVPDGALRFQDRSGSGVRFFGAGRTYPSTGDGHTRLLFAGAAVVVEGLGSLKGLRGSLTIIGEISARAVVSLVVTGRFDDDGPLERADRLDAPVAPPLSGRAADATILTFAGEADTGSDSIDEALRAAHIENDLSGTGRARSLFRAGALVGHVTGPLPFDPAVRRCAVPLPGGRRELTFTDPQGHPLASIVAEALEGTAFPDQHAGDHVTRVVAYGPLTGGGGALSGAGGVITMDTAVAPGGMSASVYTLWLVDPQGRFRARTVPDAGVAPVVPGIDGAVGGGRAKAMQFVESSVRSIQPADVAILERADQSLADGMSLLRWFDARERTADYAERFEIARPHGVHEHFGFFDVVSDGDRRTPVMGIVQDMFFDRERGGAGPGDRVRASLESFVMRYLLRVCGGYQQLFYKRADGGAIGKFAADERASITDLRDLGTAYDWLLLKEDVFSYDLPLAPFGAGAPRLEVPLNVPAYVVLGPSFISRGSATAPGASAEFGFGYAYLPHADERSGALTYGPGYFRTAGQLVRFRLAPDGEIRVRTALVVSRPEHMSRVDVDPIGWGVQLADLMTFRMASRLMSPLLAVTDKLPLRASGFDPVSATIWMANAVTGGLAEKHLGISRTVVEKRMLLQHFRQHQEMLQRSLQVWRMAPDWTADDGVPEFCRKGVAWPT